MNPTPLKSRTDEIEPELLKPVPRRVQMRSVASLGSIYNVGCSSILLVFGLGNLLGAVGVFRGSAPHRSLDVPLGLFAALLFGLPAAVTLWGTLYTITTQRALVKRGTLYRARVESIEVTTGKNAQQNIALVWEEGGQARREMVAWRGLITLLPEQMPAFEEGQPVSVLVDDAHRERFVVYSLGFYRAL